MTLQQYLQTAGLSQKAFAKKIDRTQVTVSRLCSGISRPSLDLAFLIERSTGGVVKASSWVGESGVRSEVIKSDPVNPTQAGAA